MTRYAMYERACRDRRLTKAPSPFPLLPLPSPFSLLPSPTGLPIETQNELNPPAAGVVGGGNVAISVPYACEVGVQDVIGRRHQEVDVVERVEQLRAELYVQPLGD